MRAAVLGGRPQMASEAKDALFTAGTTDATWTDALVEVCTRSLTGIGSGSRRELFTIIVHLDSEGSRFHHGPALPPALAEQLGCDGQIQPLWTTEGHPPRSVERR